METMGSDKTLNDYITKCVRLELELAEAKREVEGLRCKLKAKTEDFVSILNKIERALSG